MNKDLHIAEIPYENGNIKFRFTRYLSDDGARWIRHGKFVTYHSNGNVASEGDYENDSETGLWRDYHENGILAAQGTYVNGVESDDWEYWDAHGNKET